MCSLIKCVTFLLSKAYISINVLFLHFFYKIDSSLVKKFERFKKRVKFEFEVAIYDVLS